MQFNNIQAITVQHNSIKCKAIQYSSTNSTQFNFVLFLPLLRSPLLLLSWRPGYHLLQYGMVRIGSNHPMQWIVGIVGIA